MNQSIKVLIVEDNKSDYLLILHQLKASGFEVQHAWVESEQDLVRAICENEWDLVISDYHLGGFYAPDALEIIQKANLDIPFIVVSGTIGEDAAVALMRAGAQDYLMKDNLGKLAPVVQREIREAKIRHEQKRLNDIQKARARMLEHAAKHPLADITRYLVALLVEVTSSRVGYIIQKKMNNGQLCKVEVLSPPLPWQSVDEKKAGNLHLSDPPICLSESERSGYSHRLIGDSLRITRELFLPGNGSVPSTDLIIGIANKPKPYTLEDIQNAHNLWNLYSDIREKIETGKRLEQQVQQLSALYAVETAINSKVNLQDVLEVLLDQIKDIFDIHAVDILVWDANQQVLRYKAGRGFMTDILQSTSLKLGIGYAGRAAVTGEVVYVQNVLEERNALADSMRTKKEEFIAYYGFPLFAKGQLEGVLEVFHRDPIELGADQISFLKTLANQAANVIDKLKLVEELKRINVELSGAYDATLEGWSHALDLRDKDSEDHSQRVTSMTVDLARRMGFSEEELIHVRRGALLHDIGKLGIPDAILHKPGQLTPEERTIIEYHPVYAFQWISQISFLRTAMDIPYCHHEKWDGSGYPRGLKGEEIPLSARIFAIVDVWDALLSDRPYRSAWPKEKVIEYIRSLSDTHFDPKVVKSFLALVDQGETFDSA